MRRFGIATAGCALALAGICAMANGADRALPVAVYGGRAVSQSPVASRLRVAEGPGALSGRSPPSAARPALWRTYVMIVNLENLPRTYTCDQLWYEFHGILLRLGAWPYTVNILPYHCSPSPSGVMTSPDVQVQFQLPFFLQGVAAKSAPAMAIERTLRLSPGEPKTLHSTDCQLMRQISRTLLSSLPVRIEEQHFDCSASPRRAAHFEVTLSLPMGVRKPALAATSAPGPH